MWMVSTTATLPRERPDTHCTGGLVGLGAGLNGNGKSRPHRVSNLRSSNPNESIRYSGQLFLVKHTQNVRELQYQLQSTDKRNDLVF
jgi:hypothetical protein